MAVSPRLGDPMGAGVCNRILRCSSRHTSLEHQAAELYKYLKQVYSLARHVVKEEGCGSAESEKPENKRDDRSA